MSIPNEGDKHYVVVEKGQRIGSLHKSQEEALKEAKNRNKLAETQNNQPPTAQVKQNLFG